MKAPPVTNASSATESWGGLSRAEWHRVYRTMLLSRRLDDKEIQLKNQSRTYFQISAAGHEAIQTAAAMTLRAGHDWFFPYYRDQTLCLALGITPLEMLLASVAADADPSSGGRQMPAHWSSPQLHIVSPSSCCATQCLHAVGAAEASEIGRRLPELAKVIGGRGDEVAYVALGDGSTSEGEFWESLNTACTQRLPVIYVIEDNGYAISVPVEVQTPGGDIAHLVESFPGLRVIRVDGTDVSASFAAMREAADYARGRSGPVLVRAAVTRLYSHSMSDDDRAYRSAAERKDEEARDPLTRCASVIEEHSLATPEELAKIGADVDHEIEAAVDRALAAPQPDPGTATRYVYSPSRRSRVRAVRSGRYGQRPAGDDDRGDQPHPERGDGARRANSGLRGGRRGREPGRGAFGGAGQGRRVQGHARSPAGARGCPGLQLAPGRGKHCRPRCRHGHPRLEAGG